MTLGILVEAEDLADYGGWVLDSQFELQMGSPYLLAHGLGLPVVARDRCACRGSRGQSITVKAGRSQ